MSTPQIAGTQDQTHEKWAANEPPAPSSNASTLSPPPTPIHDQQSQQAIRYYSSRNPVPQTDLWDAVPDGLRRPYGRGDSKDDESIISYPEYPKQEKEQGKQLGAKRCSTCGDIDRSYRIDKRWDKYGEEVTDPITGKEVHIIPAKHAPPDMISRTDPPVSDEPSKSDLYLDELKKVSLRYLGLLCITFIVINGVLNFSYIWTLFILLGGSVSWWRKVKSGWENLKADEQRTRSNERRCAKAPEGNESVEWLNGVIAKLWPQINTELLDSLLDIIEDVMQASIPRIVHQVRISDVGLGTHPVQLLSIKWLDDTKNEECVPDENAKKPSNDMAADGNSYGEGEWVSLELSFMYRALPSGAKAASKAQNVHLLVNIYAGLKGVVATDIPVWTELKGAIGRIRMKVQLIPDPPFIKFLTFTFMGMPKIEIAAVPLNQHFIDVLNIPIISDFIMSAINTAADQYIAPRSHTLDMYKIILGEDSKKELDSVGVLIIHIKKALGIRSADINGKSDCYVTVSYSKYRKPLWSSRIIFENLKPVWEEYAVLLVNTDELKAKENLRVELWDSDRFTVDDVLGHVETGLMELVHNKGKTFDREDKLHKGRRDNEDHGTLFWSVAFHGKADLNPDLATDGADERVHPKLRRLHSSFSPQEQKVNQSTPINEARVLYVPPDPDLPSGILSIQIHNIVGLAKQQATNTKSRAKHQGEPPVAEEEEEGINLPSPYCSIILDDRKIYKTRVKPMSSKPFFNAGTERFVRDWRYCNLMVVVKDSRLREVDPILGVIEIKLAHELKNASMVSRWYTLQGGAGYGKIRITVLFRSLDIALPRSLQGADVGSIEIVTRRISGNNITNENVRNADYLTFRTPIIKKKAYRDKHSNDGIAWVPHHKAGFRLGVRHRHGAACVITFRHRGTLSNRTLAMAIVWLKDIVPDEEEVTLTVPVVKPKDERAFEQNYYENDSLEEYGEIVGTIEVTVKFHRGLGHSHRSAGAKVRQFADVIAARECLGDLRGEGSLKDKDDDHHEHMRHQHLKDKQEQNHEHSHQRNTSNTTNNTNDTSGGEVLSSDEEYPDSSSDASNSDSGSDDNDDYGQHDGNTDGERKKKRHRFGKWHRKKNEFDELHHQDRGIMQYKPVRTAAWLKSELKDVGRGFKDRFEHGGQGSRKKALDFVESEV